MDLPGANQQPAIDDYVVEPETRQELIDGQIVYAAPASPPHGDRHVDVAYVLRACAAPGYVVSADLLTRTSHGWNFATDACIRKHGVDPSTGSRYLEQLVVEVKHTQRPKNLIDRARQLSARGVGQILAVFVKVRRGEVLAGPVKRWSADNDDWIVLGERDVITDECLVRPIRVPELLSATEANRAVARALIAQGNPVLAEREAELKADSYARGERAGLAAGRRQFVRDLFARRFGELSTEVVERLDNATTAQLHAWAERLPTATSPADVFDDPGARPG